MPEYHPLDATEEWWRQPWVCGTCGAWFMLGDGDTEPDKPVTCPACGVRLTEEGPMRPGEHDAVVKALDDAFAAERKKET